MSHTMAISLFKTHALRIIEEVARLKESIFITRRGKTLAELVPAQTKSQKLKPGLLAQTLLSAGDLISPVTADSEWEANQ